MLPSDASNLASLPYIIGFTCLALLFLGIIVCFIIGTFPCLARRKRRSRKCFRKPSVLSCEDLEMGAVTSTSTVTEEVKNDRPLFREPRRVKSQPSGHCFVNITDEHNEKYPKDISSTGTQTNGTDHTDHTKPGMIDVMIDVILDILQRKGSCTIATQTNHEITIDVEKVADPWSPVSNDSTSLFDDNFTDIETKNPTITKTSVGDVEKVTDPWSPVGNDSTSFFDDNFSDIDIKTKNPAITKTSVGAMSSNHIKARPALNLDDMWAQHDEIMKDVVRIRVKKASPKKPKSLDTEIPSKGPEMKIPDPEITNENPEMTTADTEMLTKTANPNKQRRRGYIDTNGRQMFV